MMGCEGLLIGIKETKFLLRKIALTFRKNNMKKVYISMCADAIHHGHVNIIEQARKLGEVTVGLMTDRAIVSYKRVPLFTYEQRKKIVENIIGVKNVIPQHSLDFSVNLKKIKPDYVVHGSDWKTGVQK